jgi:peptide/nickel transport system substrate-binding protein
MNLLDQTIKFGWRDYPFDVGSVDHVGYISFENKDLLPWMQESWELSEDQSSLVINIRPGVLSSTGNELTADDFAYRIDRAFALGAIGAFFTNTVTMDPNNPYEILGKHQIKINSTGPNGLLLPIWANSAWQVVDATEALAAATDDDEWSVEWMAQNCIGFGSIAIDTFGTGERVSYTANKNYFRGEQPISTLVYEEVPQASNRLAAVAGGEADAAYGLPGELFRDRKS